MNQNNFLEVIKKYPEQKMVFEIPKDKLAKEFKQFVKEFFEKNSIKNPYKFKIVESY